MLIGPIIGDVVGSVYEWNNIKTKDFNMFNPLCEFTDDTVMTIAVADSILTKRDFGLVMWEYGRKYGGRGYGEKFANWLDDNQMLPYNSFGNGSAMRVSPIGYAYNDLEQVLDIALESAIVTHNHPEGIKGAQSIALAICLSRHGKSKKEIKNLITKLFNYNLDFTLEEIRPNYTFDVTCQGSVPHAIVSFLESTSFEDAIRLAVSIGGDSDTIACIAGSISSAYYAEIPIDLINFVTSKLPSEFIDIINEFDECYGR
jgi:ADP-ribosylglycohydrolase